MKRILIAVAYNSSAEKVAEAGYKFAREMQAEVLLLHVISDPAHYAIDYFNAMGYRFGYAQGIIPLMDDIRKEVSNFMKAAVRQLEDKKVKIKIIEGEAADSILKCATRWKADLLVMGSRRHIGLERLLVTYTTAHVLMHAVIPLLTIPTLDK